MASTHRSNIKSAESLRSLGIHGSPKKKSENPKKAKVVTPTVPKSKHTPEKHLDSPVARETPPLEAVLMSRFDLNYKDAICIVADARINLGISKWDPWTNALYKECKILYELNPITDATKNIWKRNAGSTHSMIWRRLRKEATMMMRVAVRDGNRRQDGRRCGLIMMATFLYRRTTLTMSTQSVSFKNSKRRLNKTEQTKCRVATFEPTESKVDETVAKSQLSSSRYLRKYDSDGVDYKNKAIDIEKNASNGVNASSDVVNAADAKKKPRLAARLFVREFSKGDIRSSFARQQESGRFILATTKFLVTKKL